jgi:hypothetical protein
MARLAVGGAWLVSWKMASLRVGTEWISSPELVIRRLL